ncbi:hypothetical protein N7340_08575 [Comamonas aquatica]|uniref:hypothetical protein n=1 Tax=Comamonas aquatica TaxID=225991 RepID=UPI0024483F81|nr:hypothetical protein [Comamonas aquatica]MDH0371826.1 hypothetical protein [Comamonas aquatica]
MLATRWRLVRFQVLDPVLSVHALQMSDVNGVLSPASMAATVAPSSGTVTAAGVDAVWPAGVAAQPGFALVLEFSTAVTPTQYNLDANAIELSLEYYDAATQRWVLHATVARQAGQSSAVWRPVSTSTLLLAGALSRISTAGLGMSGVGLSVQDGALQASTTDWYAAIASPYLTLQGNWSYSLRVAMQSDAMNRRHFGIYLPRTSNINSGYRIALLDGQLVIHRFQGVGVVATQLHAITVNQTIVLGVQYEITAARDGADLLIKLNGVQLARVVGFEFAYADLCGGLFAYQSVCRFYSAAVERTVEADEYPAARVLSTLKHDGLVLPSDVLPATETRCAGVHPVRALDVEVGGQGCIYGTVELYAQAGNIPLPRRVRLYRSRDGLLVRETWSDAQGNYRFDHISQRYTYDVIAWDHEGLQQSVVANDLTPEVMP